MNRYRTTTNVDYGEVDQHLSSITRVAYYLLILPDVDLHFDSIASEVDDRDDGRKYYTVYCNDRGDDLRFGHSPNNAEAA